jgi:Ca2+-binding EF-hand superfamily protein
MEESSLCFEENHLNELTDVMLAAAGKDRDGSISFEDFINVLEKHPGVLENLTLR